MKVKYPRTYHLPWSPGLQSDDKLIESLEGFINKDIVVSPKLDGENTTLARGYYHARSLDSRHHPSRDWIKGFHGMISHDIPEGWRLCGENLYAKHSIHYKNLESYFYLFSVWDSDNYALDWESTKEWAELLKITIVPTLYEGPFNESILKSLHKNEFEGDPCEGYVIRIKDKFHYNNFSKYVAKYVREGHVQSDQHWMYQEITKNELRS